MARYIFQRIIAILITLFLIVSIGFLVIRLMPGGMYSDNPELPLHVIEALEAKAHLDKPMIVQYYHFLKGIIIDGDWGLSVKIAPSMPVFDVIKARIPNSMMLNIASLIVSLPIGIIAGTIAALYDSKYVDNIISFIVVLFISIPSFVFASAMQYILAFKFGWFPIVYEVSGAGWTKVMSLVLPVLALSFGPIARITRYLRGELIDTLNSEFMLLAKTKGLSDFQATARHAFRNSLLPLANIIIPMFTSILSGSLVTEKIFSIPGVGGIMIDSINTNDHYLTIAVLLFYSVISLATILIVDISYGIIDPRVRLGGK